MKKLTYILTVILVLGFISPAYGADGAVAAMQKRYGAIQSMKAEFTQTLTHKESGNIEERRGVLYFAKPLLVRWETLSPIPELLLVTPEAVWNAFPDEDLAYKYPAAMSAESESMVRILTGQSALDKDFTVETRNVKDGLTTLALYPHTPSQSMTEAELAIETATGRIKRVVVIDFYYNRNEIVFTSQELDPKLDPALFTFTPPKGMKIEDKTQSAPIGTPLTR